MRPGGLLALLVLGSVVGLPATCAAQQVQVTVKGNPPHYAGVPIEITVILVSSPAASLMRSAASAAMPSN